MPLTIHVGAHKTATTHLQASWRAVIPQLRRRGLYYAGPIDLRQQRCPLTLALSDPPQSRKTGRARAYFDMVREVYPQILISDENILGGTRREYFFDGEGRVYPDAATRIGKLIAMLGHQPAVVALAVRDPARFQVSAFSLQLLQGTELDLVQYLDGRRPWAVDWTDLAQRILAVPGVLGLIVWRYEDYGKLRPAILERLLPAGVAGKVPDPRPVNVGLSQQGYEWLVKQAMKDSGADLRRLAGQARQKHLRADGYDRLNLLSAGDAECSARAYADDMARLRRLPRVEFLMP